MIIKRVTLLVFSNQIWMQKENKQLAWQMKVNMKLCRFCWHVFASTLLLFGKKTVYKQNHRVFRFCHTTWHYSMCMYAVTTKSSRGYFLDTC